jgi:glycosyltransferase involved in cell wall biosynthesis
MDLSIIVPLFNEEESIPELVSWINRVLEENKFSGEIIMVDDGSNDRSWEVIEQLKKEHPNVIGIKFRRNYGKSAALNVGFEKAKGDVVVTMDADLQDSPDELPGLYKMIANDGYDLVSGWKQKRHDPISKTLPSKFFNRITRMVSGIKLHDFNCGLKAYRNAVVKSIEVFGEMHRYIPFIAKQAGFTKIGEKVVEHRARKYGVTKFGLERFFNGFLDLLTISFISRFGKKPMHFFGLLGTFMFFIGFLLTLYMGIDKMFFDTHGRLLASRTEFYVALFVMMVGVQLFLTGYVAELISRNAADRNNYLIEEILDKD